MQQLVFKEALGSSSDIGPKMSHSTSSRYDWTNKQRNMNMS